MTASRLAAAIALGLATEAHGQTVVVDVHPAAIETYDVRGSTIDEVSRHLGPSHVAHTQWRVTWKYHFEESGACRLKDFHVDVSATIRMPRWVDRDAALPIARARWDAFDVATRKHEEGHRDHGTSAGQELAREILGVGSRNDCRELKAAIEEIASRVIATYQEADVEYDRATNHGISQGAKLH